MGFSYVLLPSAVHSLCRIPAGAALSRSQRRPACRASHIRGSQGYDFGKKYFISLRVTKVVIWVSLTFYQISLSLFYDSVLFSLLIPNGIVVNRQMAPQ